MKSKTQNLRFKYCENGSITTKTIQKCNLKKKTYFIQFSLSYVEEVLTSIGFASQNNVSNFQVIREVKI